MWFGGYLSLADQAETAQIRHLVQVLRPAVNCHCRQGGGTQPNSAIAPGPVGTGRKDRAEIAMGRLKYRPRRNRLRLGKM